MDNNNLLTKTNFTSPDEIIKQNKQSLLPNISIISASSVFKYAVIFCICILYFQYTNITINFLFGMFIAMVWIYVLYIREIDALDNSEQLHEIKSNHIIPKPEKLTKYHDITDLIFSIQDLYEYNPDAFEKLVKYTDTFFDVYEVTLSDHSLAGSNYSIAESHKLLALNALHSLIISVPSDKKLISKLNNAMEMFEKLLNNYIISIHEINTEYVKINGYFNNSKIIELNIFPYNKYAPENLEQYY